MNKLIKTLFITIICTSIITSGFAFANTGNKAGCNFDQTDYGRTTNERMTEEEITENQDLRQESRENRQVEQEENKEKLLTLVNEFTPNLVDDFEYAFDLAETLTSQIAELRVINKSLDDEKDILKDTFDGNNDKPKSSSLTPEESILDLGSLRTEESEDTEENPNDEDLEALEAEKEAKRKAFQIAIEENNEDIIVEHLEDVLSNMQKRNIKLAEKLATL